MPIGLPTLRTERGATFPTGDSHRSNSSALELLARDSGYIPGSRHCQSARERPTVQPETDGSPRHTRAPVGLKAPSYTAPPGPNTPCTRPASARAAVASPTIPYTAGPHDLSPPPTP